ncbi:MAG: hypothetical protein U0794_01490 [Isosphaeraceae bacterium]
MLDPVARGTDRPPPWIPTGRLERWLTAMIQGGGFQKLPRYVPLRGRDSQCPEQYAHGLLTALRAKGTDERTLERLKDDGRAFRSWAELARIQRPQHGRPLRRDVLAN